MSMTIPLLPVSGKRHIVAGTEGAFAAGGTTQFTKGTATIVSYLTTTGGAGFLEGVLESFKPTRTGDVEKVKDESGTTFQIDILDPGTKFTMEIMWPSSGVRAELGSLIAFKLPLTAAQKAVPLTMTTLPNSYGVITSWSQDWSKEGFTKVTIEAEAPDAMAAGTLWSRWVNEVGGTEGDIAAND